MSSESPHGPDKMHHPVTFQVKIPKGNCLWTSNLVTGMHATAWNPLTYTEPHTIPHSLTFLARPVSYTRTHNANSTTRSPCPNATCSSRPFLCNSMSPPSLAPAETNLSSFAVTALIGSEGLSFQLLFPGLHYYYVCISLISIFRL